MMLEVAHRMQRKQSVDQMLEAIRSDGFVVADLLRKVHNGVQPDPTMEELLRPANPQPGIIASDDFRR